MMQVAAQPLFKQVALIGIGLINSSLARALRRYKLCDTIIVSDISAAHLKRAEELKLCDQAVADAAVAVKGADLVVLGVPLSAVASVAAHIGAHLSPGAIVTDVGSTKQSVIADIMPHLPKGVYLVPGHPIAGTENSGPDAGFPELFEERFCLITPTPDTPAAAVEKIRAMWAACGMTVEMMDAAHHDRVLAITSHLPHLIAYTIVGTAADLGDDLKQEVIRYSASGFRDFTRIAASDPTMWRDVFLNNKEAVLDIIQRFTEDLTGLQQAIRKGQGDKLFDLFTRTRTIRRGIINVHQEKPEDAKTRQS